MLRGGGGLVCRVWLKCLDCCSCPAGCSDPTSLDSLSAQEKKRQGYIHELIEAEERYVEDLQVVLEVNNQNPTGYLNYVTKLLRVRLNFACFSV